MPQPAFGFADFLVFVSCPPFSAAKLVLEDQALGKARVADVDRYRQIATSRNPRGQSEVVAAIIEFADRRLRYRAGFS
jgi:hypothetical protein